MTYRVYMSNFRFDGQVLLHGLGSQGKSLNIHMHVQCIYMDHTIIGWIDSRDAPQYTGWCSEIDSLTSLDAPDVREPISLHQAVLHTVTIHHKPKNTRRRVFVHASD